MPIVLLLIVIFIFIVAIIVLSCEYFLENGPVETQLLISGFLTFLLIAWIIIAANRDVPIEEVKVTVHKVEGVDIGLINGSPYNLNDKFERSFEHGEILILTRNDNSKLRAGIEFPISDDWKIKEENNSKKDGL